MTYYQHILFSKPDPRHAVNGEHQRDKERATAQLVQEDLDRAGTTSEGQ